MLRFLRYIIEFIAAFVGVAVIIGLLLAWRLSVSPLTSDFLTPYIEAGIEGIVPDSDVHLGATLLTWNGAERAILVHAEDIRINDHHGGEIAAIPSFDAKISVLGLVLGQFMPKDLDIDHPQIKLVRGRDGAFGFAGMVVAGAGQTGGDSGQKMQNVLHNLANHLSHTALMHKLAVSRAVFDIHDELTQKDWAVSIPEISITRNLLSEHEHQLEYGALDGHMNVEVTQNDAVATVAVHYGFNPAQEEHSLSISFDNLTPAFIAGGHPESVGLDMAAIAALPLTGKIDALFDKNFNLNNIDAHIQGDEGQLVYAPFWDKPVPVKSFELNATYDRTGKTLTVEDSHIDLDGPVINLHVDGVASAQKDRDLDLTALVKIEQFPINRYGELWPKTILPDPRYWLASNLRDGVFPHSEATLKGSLAFDDPANMSIDDAYGKMSGSGARVIYLDGLPPVENVNADATFDLKQMTIQINSGNIGNIRISPFTAQITGLADEDQDIDIPLKVAGPIPEVLRLLDHQPLGYAKALGVAPDDIGGKIDGLVSFHFPLLKTLQMKDLIIHATANAVGVSSIKLVPGIPIDQGNLALTLDTSGFQLKGQADLGKAPFQIALQQNFEPGAGKPLLHINANGVIREDQWANFGITIFDDTRGPINTAVELTKPNKEKMTLTGTLDMTPAALHVDILNWNKNAGVPAIVKFTALSVGDKPVVISGLNLHGAQVMGSGDAIMSSDMKQLLAINMNPIVVGRTNAIVHFSQSFEAGGNVHLDARGVSLDIAGATGGKKRGEDIDTRPQDYHIEVGKLYTSATGELDNARGDATRDKDGWSMIDLHGLADGSVPLNIDLTPQPDGHRIFSIASDDFGKSMKALGFTDTIKGGKLSIMGQSTADNPRLIIGKAHITDFTVVKLPALALLLNATSPFGFTGILTDSADFSKFNGDFRWQGDMVTLTRANAAGSAIGINISGKVDVSSGDANLQGTLVPFSVVNKFLNYIPILGDLITGGQDQGVLAVAYQIKGPLNAPNISVNPVSLLTPGFVRNLFFSDDIDDDNQ